MTCHNFKKSFRIASLSGALAFGTVAAFADSFSVTYLAAGVQTPTDTNYYETFDNATVSNGILTTNYNGSPITGTYSGNFAIVPANLFGGAGGSLYITTTGHASFYTLSLSQPVNYFGLWFSALDGGNYLNFYNGNSLVESFTPKDFINLVGPCPGANPFCGNPNNGLDPEEQFAYLNFYDTNGTFNTIVFGETLAPTAELESDNHAVANLASSPGGTIIPASEAPEPASLFMVATGIFGLTLAIRRGCPRRNA
ncbi:MAG TPA: hypothetical protein VF214_07135 [Edaphobacter sp.]